MAWLSDQLKEHWARIAVIACAVIGIVFLVMGWRAQSSARLLCQGSFGKLGEHNGYIQINVVAPPDGVAG